NRRDPGEDLSGSGQGQCHRGGPEHPGRQRQDGRQGRLRHRQDLHREARRARDRACRGKEHHTREPVAEELADPVASGRAEIFRRTGREDVMAAAAGAAPPPAPVELDAASRVIPTWGARYSPPRSHPVIRAVVELAGFASALPPRLQRWELMLTKFRLAIALPIALAFAASLPCAAASDFARPLSRSHRAAASRIVPPRWRGGAPLAATLWRCVGQLTGSQG